MAQLRGEEVDRPDRIHGRSVPAQPRSEVQPAHVDGSNESEELSLLGIATAVLRYRRSLFVGAAIAVMIVVVSGLLASRDYETTASFVPQTRRTNTPVGASAIAAQFGLSLPSSEAGQSPQFYVDLLTSDEILRNLVDSVYTFRADTGARATNSS